jgi:hypothetical protein
MPVKQPQQQDGRLGRFPDAALVLGKSIHPAAENLGRLRLLEPQALADGAHFLPLPQVGGLDSLLNLPGKAVGIFPADGLALAAIRAIPAGNPADGDQLALVGELPVAGILRHVATTARAALFCFRALHGSFLLELDDHRARTQGNLDVRGFPVRTGRVVYVLPQGGVVDGGHGFVKHAPGKRENNIQYLVAAQPHGGAVDQRGMGKGALAVLGDYRLDLDQIVVRFSLFRASILTVSVSLTKGKETESVLFRLDQSI